MALAYHIAGPTLVEWKKVTEADGAYRTLGYTDNDDLPQFEPSEANEKVTSTLSGDEPAEVIFQGIVGALTFSLVDWDNDNLQTLKDFRPDGIGKVYVSSTADKCIAIRFTPLNTGAPMSYTFAPCIPQAGAFSRLGRWGNTAMRHALAFTVLTTTTGNEDPGV